MKRFYLILVALVVCVSAFAQEITVRFTGQLNGTDYCRLDSVAVTNLTRNWTETIEYPDTIIVLGGTVGTDQNIATAQGLGQNIPNPFDCETHVELSVSQREDVHLQLIDVAGKVYAEYNGFLDAGMHIFDITAANPQTYLLNARVGRRSYSIRMVNVGSGCGNNIKYAGFSGGIEVKLTSTNEFHIGDNMRYVGYATIEGEIVESDVLVQIQAVNQYITLNFTHYYRPSIETGIATNITNIQATLNGIIIDNGGSTITSCGFYYGTSEDNLSQNVTATANDSMFSYELTNLTPSTIYYYMAYANNSVGITVGCIATFTTSIISTNEASNINTNGAVLNGSIIGNGGTGIISCGFFYGTNEDDLSQNVTATVNGGEFSYTLTGLTPSTTYYYRAYATSNTGTPYIGNVMQFTTLSHEWVDLGLPSGTRWATCNVGANTPTDYGNYYAWGETTPKNSYTEENYTYSDNPETLPVSADAATANWGSGWRMPTSEEMNELMTSCTIVWTTINGVGGRQFTGPNGNSIFLPAAGHRGDSSLYNVGSLGRYWSSSLWSSSLYTDYPYGAWYLSFGSGGYYMDGSYRGYGQSVRPVCVSAQN